MINIAIIPARGGSKRIPGKNIKDFAGKPIITYSISAAQDAGIFDRIIVSTDCDEIANIAELAGAEVPFVRSQELSDDYTPTVPVLEHTIKWLLESNYKVNYFSCIYPAAPFIRSKDLKCAFERLYRNNFTEVFSVTTFDYCIFRALKKAKDGHIEMYWPENELVRSQDLPEAFHDAGVFYMFNCEAFMKTKKMFDFNANPYFLPRHLTQDIDTFEDWEIAERIYKANRPLDTVIL